MCRKEERERERERERKRERKTNSYDQVAFPLNTIYVKQWVEFEKKKI